MLSMKSIPPRLQSLFDSVNLLVAAVTVLGTVALAALLTSYGWGPAPLLPWLSLAAAGALISFFPFQINSRQPYYLDFNEILLILSLLYLGAGATVGVLVCGNLVGAAARRSPARKLVFNAGTQAAAASAALAAVHLLPVSLESANGYLMAGLVAGFVHALVSQVLVTRVVSLVSGEGFNDQLLQSLRVGLVHLWPTVIGYGVLIGLAARVAPISLVLAAVLVSLRIATRRQSQLRSDEHQLMRALYSAAQRMQDAANDQEVVRALQDAVRTTLGVDGAELRTAPPVGAELGAWLPNHQSWIVIPQPGSELTRHQDESFVRALASLVDAGMERAVMMGELERQSFRDPLTNAYNRRYFLQQIARVLEAADEKPGCLALIDVDYFKVINDSFGHEAGDEALRLLVATVGRRFRSEDVLCRIGGDEFALILPGVHLNAAVQRLEGLRSELKSLCLSVAGGGEVGFRASVGVAMYPDFAREPQELLRVADRALYMAKRGGRNRVAVAEREDLAPTAGGTRRRDEREALADYEHDDEVVGDRYGEEVAVDPV